MVHFGLSPCLQHNARRHPETHKGNYCQRPSGYAVDFTPGRDEKSPCRPYVARYARSTPFILIGSDFSKSDCVERKENSEPPSVSDHPLTQPAEPIFNRGSTFRVERPVVVSGDDERSLVSRMFRHWNRHPGWPMRPRGGKRADVGLINSYRQRAVIGPITPKASKFDICLSISTKLTRRKEWRVLRYAPRSPKLKHHRVHLELVMIFR